MVNLNKKQKKDANADFKKPKTKVGKKQQKPTLTFKSKAVLIPSQSIAQDKEDEIVTHRHLTLKKLISQAKHYSNTVRKDALSGMKELVTNYPQVMSVNIGAIFEATLELLCDDDKPVRQTLYQLFSQLLQTATQNVVSPFVSLNIVYICAALSHIQSSIRVDALAFLNLWIDHFPSLLRPFASQILPHYQNMLSTNMLTSISNSKILFGPYSSKNDKKMTPLQARVILLHSLNKFLAATLQVNNQNQKAKDADTTTVYWSELKYNTFHTPKYTKPKDDESSVLRDYYATMTNKAAFFVNSNNISDIYTAKGSAPKDPNVIRSPFEVLRDFSENVMPLIVECWLEANPNMIHGQQDSNNVHCLELLLDILQKLFSGITQYFTQSLGEAYHSKHQEYFEKYQKDIHKYFMPHFPYSAIVSDPKTEEMMISMNVYLAIVMSVYFHRSEPGSRMATWMTRIVDWITDVLAGKRDGENSGRQSNVITTKLALLLPVITKLLPVLPSEEYRYDLLQAFNTFYLGCHAQSAIKQHCLHFIAEILLPSPQSPIVQVPEDLSRDWLLSFPKLLWQLQANNLQTTSFLISTLSKYLRKFSDQESHNTEISTLQSALIPFFFTIMKKKDKQETKIFGPFIKLPSDIQLECLRLLYYLPQWSSNLLRALVATVPHVESHVATHLLELATLRSDDKSPEDHLSFLFTVVVANAAEKTRPDANDNGTISIDTQRIRKLDCVVDAVCHSYPVLDDLTSPLSISEQLLLQLMFGLHHSLIRLILASAKKYSTGVYQMDADKLIPKSIFSALPAFILNYVKQILGQDHEEDCVEMIIKLFLQIPELFSKLLQAIQASIPGKGFLQKILFSYFSDTERMLQFLNDLVNESSMQELMIQETPQVHLIVAKAKKQEDVDRILLEQFASDMSVLGMMKE